MQCRVATLNLEQDHKRWDARRDLINAEIGRLKPDIIAFNEVCIPLQSARGLRDAATARTGVDYPTQREPTAFTPLADSDGSVSHPDRTRMDRCIDYIWVAGAIRVVASGVCFNQPSLEDPSLWPSNHIGVYTDLEFGG
jgi:hypothetical protein